MAPRKLTPRQSAVLAAVERRGRATLLDLRDDFPKLPPSTVARVMEVLTDRGLVRASGDPSLIYVGGVEFVATRRSEPPSDLVVIVAKLRAAGLTTFADRDAPHATALLPLSAVLAQLVVGPRGERATWTALADVLSDLDVTWIDVHSELSSVRGEPALQVRMGVDLDEAVLTELGDIDFTDGETDVPA